MTGGGLGETDDGALIESKQQNSHKEGAPSSSEERVSEAKERGVEIGVVGPPKLNLPEGTRAKPLHKRQRSETQWSGIASCVESLRRN